MLKRALLLGVALVAVCLAGGDAPAALNESATYQGLTPSGGVMACIGTPGTRVAVRCERPDGSYDLCNQTVIGLLGTSSCFVPHTGPVCNGQPQYIVTFTRPDGSGSVVYATSAVATVLDDNWWLD